MSHLPQWIEDLSVILGIIGFVITLVVALQVSSIKRSFRSRARLPQIKKDLQKAGTALNTNLNDWPQHKNDARAHIKIAATLVQAAIPLLPRGDRNQLRVVLRTLTVSVKAFSEPRYDAPDAAWDIYSDIQLSITHLDQSMRNQTWE
jgi:hypothetical protein